MRKLLLLTLFVCVLGGLTLDLQGQSFNLKAGLFMPQMDSDLWAINMENLVLEKEDMMAGYYSAEYEQFLGHYVSFTLEGGYYKKEHHSMYKDYMYENDDPIYQNLALEMASLEIGFKFYPMGRDTIFYPYLGAGGGLYYWKYEQWGDFIDFEDNSVMEDEYLESTRYSPGVNVKAGFIIRPTREIGFSVEGRYQYVKGNLSDYFADFEKFDLSGVSVTAGIHIFL